MRWLLLISLMIFTACEKPEEIPPGFELKAKQGKFLFVLMDPKLDGEDFFYTQRQAGQGLCDRELGIGSDCEMFFWDDPARVQTEMPIRRVGEMGHFKRYKSKIKLEPMY